MGFGAVTPAERGHNDASPERGRSGDSVEAPGGFAVGMPARGWANGVSSMKRPSLDDGRGTRARQTSIWEDGAGARAKFARNVSLKQGVSSVSGSYEAPETGEKQRFPPVTILRPSAYMDLPFVLVLVVVVALMAWLIAAVGYLGPPQAYSCSQYPCQDTTIVAALVATVPTYSTMTLTAAGYFSHYGLTVNTSAANQPLTGVRNPTLCYFDTPGCYYSFRSSDACQPGMCAPGNSGTCTGNPYGTAYYTTPCTPIKSLYQSIYDSGAVYVYFEVTTVAVFLSLCFLVLAFAAPGRLVLVTHALTGLVLWAGVGVSAAVAWQWVFLWLFFAVIHVLYFLFVRSRIYDCNVILETAPVLLRRFPGIVVLGEVQVVLQCGWFMLWGWTYVTLNSRYGGFVDFMLFIIYIYISQIVKYVAHASVAGVVGCWYFQVNAPRPLLRALGRSLTTSLGSVSLGTIVTSFSKVLRIWAGFLSTRANAASQLLAACCLVIDNLLSMFNVYGFCQMAIYGHSFIVSAKKAFELITAANLRAIMIDDIISGTNFVASIMVGFGAGGLAWILIITSANGATVATSGSSNNFVTFYLPCFILGFFSGLAILDVLESMVCAVYTCYAEEPELLAINHPPLAAEFAEALDFVDEDDDPNAEYVSDHSISDLEESDDEDKKKKKQRAAKSEQVMMQKRRRSVAAVRKTSPSFPGGAVLTGMASGGIYLDGLDPEAGDGLNTESGGGAASVQATHPVAGSVLSSSEMSPSRSIFKSSRKVGSGLKSVSMAPNMGLPPPA